MAVITNTSSMDGIQGGDAVYLVSNTIELNIMELATGTLVKSCDQETAAPGDIITYTIVLTNTSVNESISQEAIRDVLDPRTTFVEGSVTINGNEATTPADYTYVGGVLTITPGDLGAGAIATITFQCQVV